MAAQPNSTQTEIQEELRRVLASAAFADSPRLSRFLAYVVETTLSGKAAEVKEYTIGLAVFDRPADFDPRLDTIVRVHASKLRTRLNDYYASDGASDPIKIRLPRGSYVPIFETASREDTARAPAKPITRRARLPIWVAAAVLLAAGFAAGLVAALRMSRRPAPAEAIRFEVLPPAGCRFQGTPQISPDGRKLVSHVLRDDGNTALYFYSLGAGAGRVLPGSEGGQYPCWLPDGKATVFFKASRLYKLEIAGAAEPVLVAPLESPFGIDWSRKGVLLLGGYPGPIRQLSNASGDLTPVTRVARPDVAHAYPHFLPDGNRFLYLARNETPGDSAVYAGSLDGTVNKRILESDSAAIFVPEPSSTPIEGHLILARAGELLAQPFDAKRLEVTGAPRRIAGGLPVLTYGKSTFSTSRTGVLAYATDAGGAGQFVWFDRTGKVVGALGPEGDLGDPVMSSDGGRVAYDQADGSNRDIWTVEVASGKTTRVTFAPEIDHLPVWSPDDARIAFESHRAPQGLYVAASRGGSTESALLPGGDYVSDWSRDGRLLLFGSVRTSSQPDSIYLLPLTGDRRPRAWLRLASDLRRPVLSPNGKWVAYASTESGRSNVFVQPFDAQSAPAPGKWQISTNGGSQPTWAADGRELYYLSPENILMASTVHTGGVFQYDWPVPLFDTGLRVLRGPRNDYTTHDGKRFLFRVPALGRPAPPIHIIVNWPAALSN